MSDAIYIASHSITGIPDAIQRALTHQTVYQNLGLSTSFMALMVCSIILLETVHFFHNKYNLAIVFRRLPTPVRWAFYYAIVLAIIFFGVFENRQFIYFQF